MKKILTAVLLIATLVSASAQTQKRPYLLMTEARTETAKQRLKNDQMLNDAWKNIREFADKNIKSNDINKLEHLSLAYLMTGDDKYGDAVKRILINASKGGSWGNSEMMARHPRWNSELQLANKAYLCAIGYDAVRDRFTASERKDFIDGMYRLALNPLLGDWLSEPTRIHTLNSMGHNWWTSCACMGGLLALSLAQDDDQARLLSESMMEHLPEWFAFAGDAVQNKPRTFDRAGGMYESLNYANFGIYEALLFLNAWKNAHPGKAVEKIPQLDNLSDYLIGVCYPRPDSLYNINFGDSHKHITASRCAAMLYAYGYEDNDLVWYLTKEQPHQHREGLYMDMPLGFLYMPDFKLAPRLPNKPTSILFSDFGWTTMRNSWEDNSTMLAVKCGHTWNHAHADASSLILFHKGVDIIKDAGNCGYSKKEYRNYFFQSEAHNVVLFNGKGQSRQQQYSGSMLDGKITDMLDAGNIKFAMANATGPYSDSFSRYFRSYLWLDNVVYVIDDIRSHQPGKFTWVWHPNGTVKKNGADINITNGQSAVTIRPLYPRMMALSDFVHDYPNDLYWDIVEGPTEDLKGTEQYWKINLPETTDRIKGLTAIILKDSVDQKTLPVMERRAGNDWIGLRVKYQGKTTDIYINQLADGSLMHMNSWIAMDGWLTDAYLTVIKYDENGSPEDPSEIFMYYGSSLRKRSASDNSLEVKVNENDEVYFSSLSKLNFIQKNGKKGTSIYVNGQPYINADFRCTSTAETVEANNKNVKPIKAGKNLIKVKLNDTATK